MAMIPLKRIEPTQGHLHRRRAPAPVPPALRQTVRIFLTSVLTAIGFASPPLFADGPTLKRLFPAGAGRGQTVDIAALGDAPKWPVKTWTDDPHIKWEAQADKGKFKVIVDAEARLGVHHVRFFDEDNAADALRYMIGPVEEQNEAEPNDDAGEAGNVTKLPIVINGILEKRGAVDTYAVELDADQTLVASLEANSNLRSPVDATVQILSSKGTVLAQNLDHIGLDPALEFVAPRKDKYLVRTFGFPETPDSTIGYAGGENFVYRLTLTSGGWIRTVKPLAFQRKEATKFQVDGVKLPQAELTEKLPDNFTGSTWPLFTAGLVHAPMLDVVDWPQSVEQVRPEKGQMPNLPIPSSMTGTLSQYNERDFYSIDAKKDVKLSIALTSRRMGFPMDGVLRVLDLSGKQVAREDDTAKEEDARLVFQPPADGNYVLEVTDAFMAGGPEWIYRIDVQPLQGDVGITVKTDHISGKLNEDIELAIAIERRNGFDRPLIIGLEGLDGKVTCEAIKAEKDAKEVKLKLKAAEAIQGVIRIVARLEDDKLFVRTAAPTSDPLLQDLWLTVK